MALKYLLVDDWTHVGWFESEIPDWSVGQEITLTDGRSFAITAIVPNPDADADRTATWNIEPA